MANTFNFGNKKWAVKKDQVLAYNSENNNFKPLPFDFSRASTATVVNKSGLIEEVGQDEPRIDFLDNTDGHLLLEPSRTNEVFVSNLLPNTYFSLQSATISSSTDTTSPEGIQEVAKMTTNNTGTFKGLTKNQSSSWANKTLTVSVFAKYISSDYIFFYQIGSDIGTMGVWFNIKDGTIGTIGQSAGQSAWSNVTIDNYGNGWYRCLATVTYGASGTDYIYILNSDSDNSNISTENKQTYLWGCQIEEGSYATSYIPTSGSSVTRAAETCNNSGNDDVFNDSEGVLYAEISALGESQVVTTITISDSSLSNRVLIAFASEELRGQFVSSSDNFTKNSSGVTIVNFNKIACVYTSTTFKVFVNGSQIGTTSTVTTALSGITEIAFDRGDGLLDFEGKVKDIRVYNEALTDAELITLTS